jgi:inositol hexakisphosphate/diphosphoinositol-pentakisphosphate kinase
MVAATDTLPPDTMFCHETLSLFKERWATLVKSFYDEKTQKLDATKIPDLDDCIKYDALHNVKIIQLLHPDIRHVYRSIRQAADFVIPQEYGVLRKHKLSLGKKMVKPLLQRITENLEIGLLENASSRVHLYFSSESHIHALRNVIQLSGLPSNKTIAATLEATELNYMSHGVFRLFLDPSKAEGDPYRYYVSVMFSPGAALNPFTFVEDNHMLPVSRPVPVNGRIPLVVFKQLLEVN